MLILVARLLHADNLYLIKEIAYVICLFILEQSDDSWERIPVSGLRNGAWVVTSSWTSGPGHGA